MKKYISIMPLGYGHYRIEADFYRTKRGAITTDTISIDAYKSGDKCGRLTPRQAYLNLLREIRLTHFKR